MDSRPLLRGYLAQVFEAFLLLHSGRAPGYSVAGGIAVSEMMACARLFQIVNVLRFVRLISFMDSIWLDDARAKAKKAAERPA